MSLHVSSLFDAADNLKQKAQNLARIRDNQSKLVNVLLHVYMRCLVQRPTALSCS